MRNLPSYGDYERVDSREQAEAIYPMVRAHVMEQVRAAGYTEDNPDRADCYLRVRKIIKELPGLTASPQSFTVGCRVDVLEVDNKLLRSECVSCLCRSCYLNSKCDDACQTCGAESGYHPKGRAWTQTGEKTQIAGVECQRYRECSAALPGMNRMGE